MARKEQLRGQRTGTVINLISKNQEKDIIKALIIVLGQLEQKFGAEISFHHQKQWLLKTIVEELAEYYSEMEFHYHFDTSSIRPDGGILFLQSKEKDDPFTYPILISEVKNQGTNDIRLKEGLAKQAKGNAIERLGKNLIGLESVAQSPDKALQ